MLPENVLLEIFDFYRNNSNNIRLWKWHLLAHVCRRWRQIVFSSPLRLNLRIFCTSRTNVEESLSIWPTFPIDIEYSYSGTEIKPRGQDNVVAALKHPDRVCDIRLRIKGSQLGQVATVMKKPFPVLTRLHMRSDDSNVLVLPKEFLGRLAPCLREITLSGIPYPTLPALLLSASHLITLELHRIPPTGYISPQAMATCLAALHRLDTLDLQFQSAIPRPERMRPPVTRIPVPSLTSFEFRGASEYLEDLVAQIDAPQLDRILIVYLNQLVDFQMAQLSKFTERSVMMTPFKHAQVALSSDRVSFDMCRHEFRRDENHPTSCRAPTKIVISCRGIDWQVSHIVQVLSQFSATLSNVVRLKLESPDHKYPQSARAEWVLLLRQFSAVQILHASWKLAKHVSSALENIPQEMVAEVLPSLNLIDLQGQRASTVEKFIIARQLSGQPVTVIDFREMDRDRSRALLEEARMKGRVAERQREMVAEMKLRMRMKMKPKPKPKTECVEDGAWEREWERWKKMKREKESAIMKWERAKSVSAREMLDKERRMRDGSP